MVLILWVLWFQTSHDGYVAHERAQVAATWKKNFFNEIVPHMAALHTTVLGFYAQSNIYLSHFVLCFIKVS